MKDLFVYSAMAVFLLAPFVRAEEPAAEPDATAEATQADVALLLVQRLGLNKENPTPPTPQEAVKLLLANKISPFAGWQLDQPLLGADLARILVQALGRQDEIPADERDNPETSAYNDFLVREYDMDVENLMEELVKLRRLAQNQKGGGSGNDPLDRRPVDPSENSEGSTGYFTVPISIVTVPVVLKKVIPVRRTTPSGQVDSKAVNATPSSPVPAVPPPATPIPPGPTPTAQPA